MDIKELNFKETIDVLYSERNKKLNLGSKYASDELALIDLLIEKVSELEEKDDIVLLGSLVDLELDFGDGEVEPVSMYLTSEFDENGLSIFSPLGRVIFGKKVGEEVTYEVNGNQINARIVSKGKTQEEEKKLQLI